MSPVIATGRLGNAAGDLALAGVAPTCRVFMGRGMVVPASPEDFYLRRASKVTVVAGDHGSVEGQATQYVSYGARTAEVLAVADPGFRFVRWIRDGAEFTTENPLAPFPVLQNTALVAQFEVRSYTVTFAAGANGYLSGSTTQTVEHGGDALPVTAHGTYAYFFDRWSDGSTQNPRTESNVTADMALMAAFRPAQPVSPDGNFQAMTDVAAVANGRGWWDLSGAYTATVKGYPLTLDLVHDTKGKLTGNATLAVAKATVVPMLAKGSAKGTRGNTVVKISLKGATADKTAAVSLALNLTVDAANRLLTGPLTGSVRSGGVTTVLNQSLALAIHGDMDGTWALAMDVDQAGTAVTGTALLTLSNGVACPLTVKGKTGAGNTALLTLAGDKANPAAKAIKIKTTITPLEGGWATLDAFSGKGYGQTLAW